MLNGLLARTIQQPAVVSVRTLEHKSILKPSVSLGLRKCFLSASPPPPPGTLPGNHMGLARPASCT